MGIGKRLTKMLTKLGLGGKQEPLAKQCPYEMTESEWLRRRQALRALVDERWPWKLGHVFPHTWPLEFGDNDLYRLHTDRETVLHDVEAALLGLDQHLRAGKVTNVTIELERMNILVKSLIQLKYRVLSVGFLFGNKGHIRSLMAIMDGTEAQQFARDDIQAAMQPTIARDVYSTLREGFVKCYEFPKLFDRPRPGDIRGMIGWIKARLDKLEWNPKTGYYEAPGSGSRTAV